MKLDKVDTIFLRLDGQIMIVHLKDVIQFFKNKQKSSCCFTPSFNVTAFMKI